MLITWVHHHSKDQWYGMKAECRDVTRADWCQTSLVVGTWCSLESQNEDKKLNKLQR
jgi:hypothetical protein